MFYSSCFGQHSMLPESTKSESLVINNNSDHIRQYAYTVKDNFTNSWTTKFFFLKDIFVTHCECSLYMQTFTAFLPCLSSFFKSSFKFSFPGRNNLRKNHQIPMPYIKNDTCMKIKTTRCVFCRSKLYPGKKFLNPRWSSIFLCLLTLITLIMVIKNWVRRQRILLQIC